MRSTLQKLERKRRSDHRERFLNFVLGSGFNISLAGGIAEKLGYLPTRIFTQSAFWFLIVALFCVGLLVAFMIWAGSKHLRAEWNDKAALEATGRGVSKAFTRLNLVAYASLFMIAGAVYFIGHHILAFALLGFVFSILVVAFVLSNVGLWRARRL